MFYIEDGREHFYQWDINRRLIIEDSTITEVHFCNKTEDCSLVVEVYEENGKHLANVPNILLQNAWNIRVYAFDAEYTKHCKVFKVTSRSKPADYVYTETELKRYEALNKKIDDVIDYSNCTFANAPKGIKSGSALVLNDLSPITNNIKLKANTPAEIKLNGKNIYNFLGLSASTTGITISDDVVSGKGYQMLNIKYTVPASLDGKRLSASCLVRSEGESTAWVSIRMYRASDGSQILAEQLASNQDFKRVNINNIAIKEGDVIGITYGGTGGSGSIIYAKEFQIEVNSISTEYEDYKEEVLAVEDTVETTPFYPVTTIFADTDIECEYYLDTNSIGGDKWQLIEAVTIEQEVQRIYCDLKNGKYKELHLHIIMPTRNPNKESNYPKGRSNVYIQGNKTVYDDGSYWYIDDGNPYCVYTYDVVMIGNICKVTRLRYPTTRPEYPYLTGYVQDRSGWTTGIHTDDDYISELSVSLLPTGSFAFSVGTTYELWGVRA